MYHTKILSQKNKLVFVLFLNCLHNYIKSYKTFVWGTLTNNDFSKHCNQIRKSCFSHLTFCKYFQKQEVILLKFVKHWNSAITLLSHFALQSTLQLITNYPRGNPLKKLLSPFNSRKNRDRGWGLSNMLNTCNSHWQ